MLARRVSQYLACAALAVALGAPSAEASCGDRPGTPTNTSAKAWGTSPSTTIGFGWTNHGSRSETQYWDINVREGSPTGPDIGRSLTGVGPAVKGTNPFVTHIFKDLKPSTTYCFQIRARSEPGTQGCVSEIWSAWTCATTAKAPSTAPKTAGSWGALAADSKGRWGYAVGYQSEAQAKDAALKGCGDAECKIAIAGQARCIAYYESRQGGYWYGLALHSSQRVALSVARSGCAKGAPKGSCKLVKALCS